jgi:uncharacterized protein (DUF58 family)
VRLTRHGWLVAALAVCCIGAGWLLGPLELYAIGAGLAMLVAGAVVYIRTLRVHIAVERQLHPPRVHAGTPSRVDLRVRNDGRRRTPVLTLRDPVTGTRGAHLLLGPLDPGRAVSAAYRLPTERRGIVEIGPLEVEMGDPFGLTRLCLHASGVSELTVFPRIDDIVPVPQTTGNDPMAGAEHPNALGRSGEDFYGLRPYVVGDDLRKVHWASTARHDELMVRQDEQPWQGRATLLVDVRDSSTTAASLELLVSAAASILTACARRQDLIRLVTTDGVDSGFAAGHVHSGALMEHLSSVRSSPDDAFDAVLDRLVRSSTGGALIAIVAGLDPTARDRLLRLRQRFGSVTVVQFEPASWDPSIPPEPPAVGRDGVLLIRSAGSFADVWNTSVRSRRTGDANRPRPKRPWPVPEAEPDEDRWARHARIRP